MDTHHEYYLEEISSCTTRTNSTSLTLPFFHTCNGEAFREIFGSKEILATNCDEFSEELLYLFYGKPSYRMQDNRCTTKDLGRFPVCFIIRNTYRPTIKRIFPFDSGAFLNNFLEDIVGTNKDKPDAMINLAKYAFEPNLDWVARFISFLYGDDKQYFKVSPKKAKNDLNGLSFELARILEMASSNSSHQWDDRATTIEIQSESKISLTPSAIEAVIMPSQFIDNTVVANFFYNHGIDVKPYDAARSKPESVTDLIVNITLEYLQQKGLV